MKPRVSVLLPGLQGPSTQGEASAEEAASALTAGLALPGFSALLAGAELCASPLSGSTLPELGVAALNIAGSATDGLAAGALSRLAHASEGGAAGDPVRVWMRADPVHLRADMGKLIVFPPQVLSLSLDEASRLMDWLQAQTLFPGPPLTLLDAHAWVCAPEPAPGMTTVSPQQAYGEDAQAVIAHGGDAASWHARMNEIQMLLHECPVNAEREREGLAPVNSLWFWGEGPLPAAPDKAPAFDAVFADDPVIVGAARLASLHTSPPAGGGDAVVGNPGGKHALLALPDLELAARARDLDAWREALDAVDTVWLAPLATALRSGRLAAVDLYCGGVVARARRPRAWLRWRRRPGADHGLARLRRQGAR